MAEYIYHDTGFKAGLTYNSPNPAAGIHYYDAKKRIEKSKYGRTKVYIDPSVESKQIASRTVIPESLPINEMPPKAQEIALRHQKIQQSLYDIKSKPKSRPNKYIPTNNADYLVRVGDDLTDFSSVGIKPVEISSSDQEWLETARYYFINAVENNRRVGSSETYTSSEILESLWATAVNVGVDPKRFIVQLYTESRFNPNLTGQAGEKGIGQFKKMTAKDKGYDWKRMKAGDREFAYQAKAAAEFLKQVGERKYNGGGFQSILYTRRISSRLNDIEKLV